MVGNIKAVSTIISAFKNNGLVLKVVEGLQDYLSCKIKFFEDKKGARLGKPHLINNLEKKFGKHVQDIQSQKLQVHLNL